MFVSDLESSKYGLGKNQSLLFFKDSCICGGVSQFTKKRGSKVVDDLMLLGKVSSIIRDVASRDPESPLMLRLRVGFVAVFAPFDVEEESGVF